LLNAALEGKLIDVEFYLDPIFGFEVPKSCPDVPENVLYPATAWPSQEKYDQRYRQLASRFINNFRKYSASCPPEVQLAGPNINRVSA
jgi:phosphoenolpyruvate carboxykinase (ATP)